MHPATRSVFVFGVYLVISGLVMAARPDISVSNMSLPAGAEVPLRPFGMVLGIIGFFYIAAARQQIVAFFPLTVWGRAIAVSGLLLFVALGQLPTAILMNAAIDAAGALWTWARLRAPAVRRAAAV